MGLSKWVNESVLFAASILTTGEGTYNGMCEDKKEPCRDGLEWEVLVFRISIICMCICICLSRYVYLEMDVYTYVYMPIYISWLCQ